MQEKTLFVGIPLHNGLIHHQCVSGMLNLQLAVRCQFETHLGSFLPRNRDILTSRFLNSDATHMLCVDSDVGFTAEDALKLLETDLDFVSGCYAKKQPDREIPARLTGEIKSPVLGASFVPGGFLLLSRQCVSQMVAHYRHLQYKTAHGIAWALWSSTFEPGKEYTGEDVAFCNRWTDIGGKIWIRPDVVLKHYGDHCYVPDDSVPLRFTL